jgi:large subunit ribosomal protein L31
MKAGIHPDMHTTDVKCTCGNTFQVRSRHKTLSIDICSACHPFYTGTQKFVDTAGRVDAFTKRFAWKEGEAVKAAEKKVVPKPTKRVVKDLATELEKKKVFGKKRIIPEAEGKEERGDRGGDRRG